MRLPLLLSVPHAGLDVPPEASRYCILGSQDIIDDGDAGAAEIYDLEDRVSLFFTTVIARAIVDLNRSEDDFSPDGVIKTQTIYGARVYSEFPPQDVIELLLERYYRPYHLSLTGAAGKAFLAIDCHTMAAVGPPEAADAGEERPHICISDREGESLPSEWMEKLRGCLEESFGQTVSVNKPFKGGYTLASHSAEMPWVQLELSRAGFLPLEEKRRRVLNALVMFCRGMWPER